MTNYLRRIEALEAHHRLVDLPVVIVFVSDGDDKDAIVAEALRGRGLQSGEARVLAVRWGKANTGPQ